MKALVYLSAIDSFDFVSVDSDLHMSTSATATATGGGPGGGPGGAAAAGSVRPNAADFHNIMHNSLSNMGRSSPDHRC